MYEYIEKNNLKNMDVFKKKLFKLFLFFLLVSIPIVSIISKAPYFSREC